MNVKMIFSIVFFLSLFYIWPNYVHEPLHLAALTVQGIAGHITHGLHPTTTREGSITLIGGLFFMLFPSIVSIILLILISKTKANAGVLFHMMLPLYLVFDLIVNIKSFATAPYSDFRFLIAIPFGSLAAIAVCIGLALWGIRIVLNSYNNMQVHKKVSLVWYGS